MMSAEASPAHPGLHHHKGAFGSDTFGQRAESFARFFGTPRFLITQTVVVIGWVTMNAVAVSYRWDPYPFILLNLVFSLQAAYAAPLILLAQTRQADRDHALSEADSRHRQGLADAAAEREEISIQQVAAIQDLLVLNTSLTEQVERLTIEIHAKLGAGETPAP
jgi:uncharacterized membrane protein